MATSTALPYTPVGTLNYLYLNGKGKETLQPNVYKYCATLLLEEGSEKCNALIDTIDKFWLENKPAKFTREPKSTGYKQQMRDVLDDKGVPVKDKKGTVLKEPTGLVEFQFSTHTHFTDGKEKVIQLFASDGSDMKLPEGTTAGNGSRGRIYGSIGIYELKDTKGNVSDAGISLYLKGVQFSKFVPYTAKVVAEALDDEDNEMEQPSIDMEEEA